MNLRLIIHMEEDFGKFILLFRLIRKQHLPIIKVLSPNFHITQNSVFNKNAWNYISVCKQMILNKYDKLRSVIAKEWDCSLEVNEF